MSNLKHKILLIVVKYIPLVLTILCFSTTLCQILSEYNIDDYILTLIIIILATTLVWVISDALKFCAYHKMLILYVALWVFVNYNIFNCPRIENGEWIISTSIYLTACIPFTAVYLIITAIVYWKYGDRKEH